MHGVPQFMRQGIHAVTVILVIEENKGLRTISASAIGASTLARSFIYIDPALGKALSKGISIILTQLCQGSYDRITRLLITYLFFSLLDNRYIKIIHMHFVEFQDSFT